VTWAGFFWFGGAVATQHGQELIKASVDVQKVFTQLKKTTPSAKRALEKVGKEFHKRATPWIAQSVSKVYNVKQKDIKSHATICAVEGSSGMTTKIEIKGYLMAALWFGMKPKAPPARVPGKKPRPYHVTLEVRKGQRKRAGSTVFLMPAANGASLPFQRTSPRRYPIKVVYTLAVPQMVSNEEVSELIRERIAEEVPKRVEHYVSRELALLGK
jgi:hypothetical protein